MRDTLQSQLDSTSDRSLIRVNSWKANLDSSLSRESRLTPIYSSKKLELQDDSKICFKKKKEAQPRVSLLQENKKLKRQIDKLNIEISMLKQADDTKQDRSLTRTKGDQQQCKKLKRLLEISCFSLQKIEEEKNLILQDNYTIVQLNKSLKEQVALLDKQNNLLKKEMEEIQRRHKIETDLLWNRINEVEEKLRNIIEKTQ